MPAAVVEFNRFPEFAQLLKDASHKAIRTQVKATEGDVKRNIVSYDLIDTGTMLNSVAGEIEPNGDGIVSVTAESDDGYPYPAAQNFGTATIPARPFFSEAVEKARAEFPRRFKSLDRGRATE